MYNPNFSIDDAFLFLNRNTDTPTRLLIWRTMFEYWFGEIKPEDGLSHEELQEWQLPDVLRQIFELAGRRSFDLASQNSIARPDAEPWSAVEITEEKRLVFYKENQGVYSWCTEMQGSDPPVWGRFNENGEAWTKEGMCLSDFMISECLFEACMTAECGASASNLPQDRVHRISKEVPQLALEPWRWPAYPSRFYGQRGVIVFVAPNKDMYSVFVAAKSPTDAAFLQKYIDEDPEAWEHLALK